MDTDKTSNHNQFTGAAKKKLLNRYISDEVTRNVSCDLRGAVSVMTIAPQSSDRGGDTPNDQSIQTKPEPSSESTWHKHADSVDDLSSPVVQSTTSENADVRTTISAALPDSTCEWTDTDSQHQLLSRITEDVRQSEKQLDSPQDTDTVVSSTDTEIYSIPPTSNPQADADSPNMGRTLGTITIKKELSSSVHGQSWDCMSISDSSASSVLPPSDGQQDDEGASPHRDSVTKVHRKLMWCSVSDMPPEGADSNSTVEADDDSPVLETELGAELSQPLEDESIIDKHDRKHNWNNPIKTLKKDSDTPCTCLDGETTLDKMLNKKVARVTKLGMKLGEHYHCGVGECQFITQYFASYVRHQAMSHSITRPGLKLYSCKICPKIVIHLSEYARHLEKHAHDGNKFAQMELKKCVEMGIKVKNTCFAPGTKFEIENKKKKGSMKTMKVALGVRKSALKISAKCLKTAKKLVVEKKFGRNPYLPKKVERYEMTIDGLVKVEAKDEKLANNELKMVHGTFQCSECHFKTCNKMSMERHRVAVHNLKHLGTSYYCRLCDMSTTQRYDFFRHCLGRKHQELLKKAVDSIPGRSSKDLSPVKATTPTLVRAQIAKYMGSCGQLAMEQSPVLSEQMSSKKTMKSASPKKVLQERHKKTPQDMKTNKAKPRKSLQSTSEKAGKAILKKPSQATPPRKSLQSTSEKAGKAILQKSSQATPPRKSLQSSSEKAGKAILQKSSQATPQRKSLQSSSEKAILKKPSQATPPRKLLQSTSEKAGKAIIKKPSQETHEKVTPKKTKDHTPIKKSPFSPRIKLNFSPSRANMVFNQEADEKLPDIAKASSQPDLEDLDNIPSENQSTGKGIQRKSRIKTKKLYPCKVCNVAFKRKDYHDKHIKSKKHNKAVLAGKAEGTVSEPAEKKVEEGKFYCEVCSYTFVSDYHLQNHMRGSVHKDNLKQQADESSGTEDLAVDEIDLNTSSVLPSGDLSKKHVEADSAVPSPSWYCDVCQMSMKSAWHHQMHFKGRRHKLTVKQASKTQKLGDSSCVDVNDKTESESTGITLMKNGRYHCQICNCVLISEWHRNKHIFGVKHQTNVKEIKVNSGNPVGDNYCDICDLSFMWLWHYKKHLAGLKHNTKLKEKSRKEGGSNGGDNYCEICDMNFNRYLLYRKHLRSSTHLNNKQMSEKNFKATPTSPAAKQYEAKSKPLSPVKAPGLKVKINVAKKSTKPHTVTTQVEKRHQPKIVKKKGSIHDRLQSFFAGAQSAVTSNPTDDNLVSSMETNSDDSIPADTELVATPHVDDRYDSHTRHNPLDSSNSQGRKRKVDDKDGERAKKKKKHQQETEEEPDDLQPEGLMQMLRMSQLGLKPAVNSPPKKQPSPSKVTSPQSKVICSGEPVIAHSGNTKDVCQGNSERQPVFSRQPDVSKQDDRHVVPVVQNEALNKATTSAPPSNNLATDNLAISTTVSSASCKASVTISALAISISSTSDKISSAAPGDPGTQNPGSLIHNGTTKAAVAPESSSVTQVTAVNPSTSAGGTEEIVIDLCDEDDDFVDIMGQASPVKFQPLPKPAPEAEVKNETVNQLPTAVEVMDYESDDCYIEEEITETSSGASASTTHTFVKVTTPAKASVPSSGPVTVNAPSVPSSSSQHEFVEDLMPLSLDQVPSQNLVSELSVRKRLFTCVCGISFIDHNMFRDHQKLHAPAEPMACAICHKKFSDWLSFHRHIFCHQ